MERFAFINNHTVYVLFEDGELYKTMDNDDISCIDCQTGIKCTYMGELCNFAIDELNTSIRFEVAKMSLLMISLINRYIKNGRRDFINTLI